MRFPYKTAEPFYRNIISYKMTKPFSLERNFL